MRHWTVLAWEHHLETMLRGWKMIYFEKHACKDNFRHLIQRWKKVKNVFQIQVVDHRFLISNKNLCEDHFYIFQLQAPPENLHPKSGSLDRSDRHYARA